MPEKIAFAVAMAVSIAALALVAGAAVVQLVLGMIYGGNDE